VVVASGLTFGNIWAQQGPRLALPSLSPGTWSFIVIAMGVSGAMALFIHAIIAQSRGRQALLEELAATRESLAMSERAAGIADERRRLAGEVHDTIAQDFTSIVMHLEAAEARIEAGGSPAEHLALARQAARNGLQGSRRIVHALLPDLLEGARIDQAIATQAARWSRETGVPVTTTIDDTPIPLDRHTEVVLFRALQEILANIIRHAQATQVTVTLSYLDDLAVLDVHDDGRGFDPTLTGAGVGLQVMRQRLEDIEGSLDIESVPGVGTTIAVSVRGERKGWTHD
jgi:signal transduction histidine kinase